MAIVINGSGTISGISVGGLPDSIVDAGTLATNSVDSAELIDGAVDDSHMAAMAASKLTGALPAISGASLTGLTYANMPAGSVIQVVNASHSSQVAISTTTWTDIGLSATITPKYSNSKILVIADVSAVSYDAGYAAIGTMQVLRASTTIMHKRFGAYFNAGSDANFYGGVNDSTVDSPSTTSATIYKIQGRTDGADTCWFQPTAQGSSRLTLIEIKQ